MPPTNLHLRSKARNLDEASFMMRAQNGYDLFAFYSYEKKGKNFFLNYSLSRIRAEGRDVYVVTIEESEELYFDPFCCSERDERFEFPSVQEAISYLKENEYFNVLEWGYQRRSKF